MAAPKRTQAQREIDLAEMTRLIRRGCTYAEIGERLGVNASQICYDWKIVIKRLAEQRTDNAAELVAIKKAELAELKKEAWDAWERSKKAAEIQHVRHEQDDGGAGGAPRAKTISEKTSKGQVGDARYLAVVARCIRQEIALDGLEPEQSATMHVTGTINWDVLLSEIPEEVPDDIEQRIAEVARRQSALPPPNGTQN